MKYVITSEIMSWIVKLIRGSFLLLAGLAISAHLIILHDHHLFESINGQKGSCQESNGKSGHHTGFPVHCHSFNDLASERLSSSVLKKNIKSGYISINRFPDNFLNELPITLKTSFNSRKPFSDIHIPDFSPFRAPPQMS